MVATHGGSDDDRIVKAGKSEPSKGARQSAVGQRTWIGIVALMPQGWGGGEVTLGELMDRYRSGLACETPAVRRSWEEMFTFTLRHYTRETPIVTFDPDFLSQRLILAGIHHLIVAGYVKRWRHMLSVAYQHN